MNSWPMICFWEMYCLKHHNFLAKGSKGLFTPWTMKSSQGLVKYVIDWLLNSSRDDFGLHRGKNMWEWPWSSRSLKDICIIIDMVQWVMQWERHNRCYSRKNTRAHGIEIGNPSLSEPNVNQNQCPLECPRRANLGLCELSTRCSHENDLP
jgi:hypothetical protein